MQLILILYCSIIILCSLSKGQEEDDAEACYTSRVSPKVIGGKDAKEAEFPFAVSIQKIQNDGITFCNNCGGVIITNKLILTAAHCFNNATPSNSRIVAGTIDLEKLDDAQIVQVRKAIKHPDYNRVTKANDIAVVVIKGKLKFTKHVKPVHLPTFGREPAIDSMCTAMGWGRLSVGGPLSRILQKVELTIEERGICRKFQNSSGNATDIVNRRMICTYDVDKATNKADSGSAMMCKDQDQNFYLAGIANRGRYICYPNNRKCTFKKYMKVFAHVGQFYCYIRNYIMQYNTKLVRTSDSVETNLKPPSKKICHSSNRNKTYHFSPKQYGVAVRQCLQNEDRCYYPDHCCTGYCRLVSGRGVICTRLQQDDPRGDPANDAFEINYFLSEHFQEYKGWFGAIWWEFNSDRWLALDDAKQVLRQEIVNTYRYMSDTDTCCVENMYKLESNLQQCIRIEHGMILLVGDYVATPRASYVFQTKKGMAILITNGTHVDIIKGWDIVSYWKERMIKNNR